jgi:histidinol-phosphate phosphatase family protein
MTTNARHTVAVRRALFLDRDGTLIVDVGYPNDPARVEALPGVIDALVDLLNDWVLVVISNQSGIARGLITRDEAAAVHERFIALFAEAGVQFAGSFYCPHGPDGGCRCRKPLPGLLHDAAEQLEIDLSLSAVVGDKPSDVEAGLAAGCAAAILFDNDWPSIVERLRHVAT